MSNRLIGAVSIMLALSLALGLTGCTAGTTPQSDEQLRSSDESEIVFDDVLLLDNEHATIWLERFYTNYADWNHDGNPIPEYHVVLKVRNNSEVELIQWIEDPYIGDEGVIVVVANDPIQPGKARTFDVLVAREWTPNPVMLDSINELYDLEFEVVFRSQDKDYYKDEYLHEVFDERIVLSDYVDNPS